MATNHTTTGQDPGSGPTQDRILTVPNLLSLTRILLIPVFVALLLNEGTEAAGLGLVVAVMSTDWLDGYVARRTGQVSALGKILDPVADRLALAAALIALVIRDAVPLWAALLVLVRDLLVVAAGLVLLFRFGVRLDVRRIGKVATFGLMAGIPLIAWAGFGLSVHGVSGVIGWICYAVGIVLYYAAGFLYAGDARRALADRRAARSPGGG